jgi:hypothetical protein
MKTHKDNQIVKDTNIVGTINFLTSLNFSVENNRLYIETNLPVPTCFQTRSFVKSMDGRYYVQIPSKYEDLFKTIPVGKKISYSTLLGLVDTSSISRSGKTSGAFTTLVLNDLFPWALPTMDKTYAIPSAYNGTLIVSFHSVNVNDNTVNVEYLRTIPETKMVAYRGINDGKWMITTNDDKPFKVIDTLISGKVVNDRLQCMQKIDFDLETWNCPKTIQNYVQKVIVGKTMQHS